MPSRSSPSTLCPGTHPLLRRKLVLRALSLGTLVLLPRHHATASESSPNDRMLMARAMAMRDAALRAGDQGYGAVIARGADIIAEAPSRVVTNGDPTAHAEMEAIRMAAQRLKSRDLSGCTLYGSSRACPMCESAAYWARVTRMVHGADAIDAGPPRLRG